ncbi:MAG: hypothetical protein D6725_13110 [Planctomycetota bacterium]|nr:MAG: hypothetical protein D6725_13110 [Planctomycetota bacterium]
MKEVSTFRHQTFPSRPEDPAQLTSLRVDASERADFSRLHSDFGITQAIAVHGTFVGDDPLAVNAWISSLIARRAASVAGLVEQQLKRVTGSVTDAILGDRGNFAPHFPQDFRRLTGNEVEAERLVWSGANTHVSRALLALRLLDRLDSLRLGGFAPGEHRVLLWGHSHAGNGFALLSNLLANAPDSVDAFFDCFVIDELEPTAQRLLRRCRTLLAEHDGPHPMARALIVVTLGTPVRYGWEKRGLARLFHVSHHVPPDPDAPEACRPPLTAACSNNNDPLVRKVAAWLDDLTAMYEARYGDWVQLFGIAGTDWPPPPVARTTEGRLRKFLERDLDPPTPEALGERFPVMCHRWSRVTRTHASGRNILLRYVDGEGRRAPEAQIMLGHGIYTRRKWLAAHLALLLQQLADTVEAP